MARTYRGWNTAATRDTGRVNGLNGITVVSDANFPSGYAWQINAITDSCQLILVGNGSTGVTLASGDTIYCRGKVYVTSVGTTTPERVLWIGDGGIETTWANVWQSNNFGVQFTVSGGVYNAQLHVTDNNAVPTGSDGTAQALTTATLYDLEWSLTIDSSTQATMRLYLNDILVDTLVHTNAGGLGTMRFLACNWGIGALAKGEAVDIRWDEVAVKTETSSGLTIYADHPQFTLLLPDGDGGTLQWTASGGGTGVYTEWDDAFGSLSTADYNNSGTAASNLTQNSTFANASLLPYDTIFGISLGASGNIALGTLNAQAMIINDGADLTYAFLQSCVSTKSFVKFWATGTGGTPFTPALVQGITGGCRRGTAGAPNDWQVYALWMCVLSQGHRPKSLIIDQAVNRAATF